MSFTSDELERVKVLIVYDHPVFAEGTIALLRTKSCISPVGIAGNGIKSMDLIRKTVPDVVLSDINLPDTCGLI